MGLAEGLGAVGLQDGLGWEDVVAFSAGALTVLTLLGVVFREPLREFGEFLRWWRKFQRDWDGEPSRDGVDRMPGVMERLNNIDGEFKRNGGKTMKDSQYRTERAIVDIREHIAAGDRTQRANIRVAQKNMEAISASLKEAGHDPPVFAPFIEPPLPFGDDKEGK